MIATISDDLTGFVERSVSNGRYTSADAAVAAGLRLLQQTDRDNGELDSRVFAARHAVRIAMRSARPDVERDLEVRDGGDLVVRGHRISAFLILQAWSEGLAVDAIHDRFPTIPREIIERLIQFATDHHAVVARWLTVEELVIERHDQQANRGPSLDELRTRLAARTATE